MKVATDIETSGKSFKTLADEVLKLGDAARARIVKTLTETGWFTNGVVMFKAMGPDGG